MSTEQKRAWPLASGKRQNEIERLQSVLKAWWSKHSLRERRLLAAAAVTVMVALLWLFALEPALRTLHTARQQLPLMRNQAAQVGAIALEAQALRQTSAAVLEHGGLESKLHESLQRAGLAQTVSAVAESSGPEAFTWRIRVDNAHAGHFMQWLASVPDLMQLTVHNAALTRATIQGRDRPGHLSGTLVLMRRPERP